MRFSNHVKIIVIFFYVTFACLACSLIDDVMAQLFRVTIMLLEINIIKL